MFQYHCLNPIAGVGLANFNENYQQSESLEGADAVLVRSAAMHGMELPKSILAVARAGAGVNNIPIDRCSEEGIVFRLPTAQSRVSLYSTHREPMQMASKSWCLPACCLHPAISQAVLSG